MASSAPISRSHGTLHPLIAERLFPKCTQPEYLHAIDLLDALKSHAPSVNGKLLDFGCGHSPYRTLFPNTDYRRADIPSSLIPPIDYDLTKPDAIPSDEFDVVLSTQVLEHVENTDDYLDCCRRALKPQGRLILTTHGFYEEHGCPDDYFRWTAHGLRTAAEKCGFSVLSVSKLTTDQRAAFFLIQRHLGLLGLNRTSPVGLLIAAMSRLVRWTVRPLMNRWLDTAYANCKIVAEDTPGNSLYIALLLVAQRPQ